MLWLIAQGLGQEAVAAVVDLSPRTVKTHLHRIAVRLHSNDTAHSIAICHRRGWFPPRGRFALTLDEQKRIPRTR